MCTLNKDYKMIINNNYPSQSFGSLKVCYNAQDALEKLPRYVVQKLYRLGNYLEGTQHVDMEVSKNLTPFIKAKCQRYGGIVPPFNISKPALSEKNLKITAHRIGDVPYGTLNGDTVELSINTRNHYSALDFYHRLTDANGDFEKAGIITRLIDACMETPAAKAKIKAEENFSKYQIIDNIMSEFGTWSK